MKSQILLFSKIPTLAPCKTRLLNSLSSIHLTESEINHLASAFLADTLENIAHAKVDSFYLASEPEITKEKLQSVFVNCDLIINQEYLNRVKIFTQHGNYFADRLDHAVENFYKLEKSGVVILGSDCPAVNPEAIKNALALVEQGFIVLGPTCGCGLYLIGLPEKLLSEKFSFQEIFKGKATELEAFNALSARHGISAKILELSFDVDIQEDLKTLIYLTANTTEPRRLRYTKKVIKTLGLNLKQVSENNRELRIIRN
jgi:uncharacterized protein